jgi:hypothetical protein
MEFRLDGSSNGRLIQPSKPLVSNGIHSNVKANAFPALEKTDDLEEIVSPRVAGRPHASNQGLSG